MIFVNFEFINTKWVCKYFFSLAIESVLLPLGDNEFIILIEGNLVNKIIYSDFLTGVW